jgi:hypothetical protein
MAGSSVAHPAGELWRLDADAAVALAPLGSPFADSRFITALERCNRRWSGHTVGAVARDDVRAAITVVRTGPRGISVPFGYGGLVADRSLDAAEVDALLHLVSRQLGLSALTSYSLPLPIRGRPAHGCGKVFASTALVTLDRDEDPRSALAKKARQSIRRAERGGVVVSVDEDPRPFLTLYAGASRQYRAVYPTPLLNLVAASGLARIYHAVVQGQAVASAFVLTGRVEWMYWLAAANELGRQLEAGYPVVAQMLVDAQAHDAKFVNLGASTGIPGVAKFKRRMAGADFPMIENSITTSPLWLLRSRIASGVANRVQDWRRPRGARQT